VNTKIKIIGLAITMGLFILSACSLRPPQPPTPTATATLDTITIANPASAYCEEQGGKLEIRTAQDNNQYGVCLFKDDSECEEWAYYREECMPGDMDVAPAPKAIPAGIANPASAFCVEQGGTTEIRTAKDGSQYGVCSFTDGSECEEWAFFRGECAP
jgi:putative hemolysin